MQVQFPLPEVNPILFHSLSPFTMFFQQLMLPLYEATAIPGTQLAICLKHLQSRQEVLKAANMISFEREGLSGEQKNVHLSLSQSLNAYLGISQMGKR